MDNLNEMLHILAGMLLFLTAFSIGLVMLRQEEVLMLTLQKTIMYSRLLY